MTHLSLLHLIFICTWFGLVMAESVLEVVGRHPFVAKVHFWIDLLFELPLTVGVLTTGILLLIPSFPPSPLLLLKISCGLIAIAGNFYCIVQVILRYRARNHPEKFKKHLARVRLTSLAIPFGVTAAYLGFKYFLSL